MCGCTFPQITNVILPVSAEDVYLYLYVYVCVHVCVCHITNMILVERSRDVCECVCNRN